MTASRDTDRFIRDFLAEGQTELSDRVYDAVRSDIDRTRQRVVIAPWKAPGKNTFAKVAIAAAAVVVVAIVGISLPPARDGVSGASVFPPTTSTRPPQPSSSPAVDVTRNAAAYPAGGVAIGMHGVTVDGIRLSFIMPGSGWEGHQHYNMPASGWEGHEHYLSKSTKGPQGAEAIIFWTTFPDGDNYIPCMDLLGSAGPSVADLAAAVSTVPGTDVVSGPTDVTVGGRPAKHVSLFVTYSVLDNSSVCYPGFFFSWTPDDEGAMWDSTLPGDTIRVWMVDVDGARLFIEAVTHFNAGPDVELEIQQIVDSIAFE
jgi:hypothetical protein